MASYLIQSTIQHLTSLQRTKDVTSLFTLHYIFFKHFFLPTRWSSETGFLVISKTCQVCCFLRTFVHTCFPLFLNDNLLAICMAHFLSLYSGFPRQPYSKQHPSPAQVSLSPTLLYFLFRTYLACYLHHLNKNTTHGRHPNFSVEWMNPGTSLCCFLDVLPFQFLPLFCWKTTCSIVLIIFISRRISGR